MGNSRGGVAFSIIIGHGEALKDKYFCNKNTKTYEKNCVEIMLR